MEALDVDEAGSPTSSGTCVREFATSLASEHASSRRIAATVHLISPGTQGSSMCLRSICCSMIGNKCVENGPTEPDAHSFWDQKPRLRAGARGQIASRYGQGMPAGLLSVGLSLMNQFSFPTNPPNRRARNSAKSGSSDPCVTPFSW